MSVNLRCSICNKVNNPEVATNIGDYVGNKTEKFKQFHTDIKDNLSLVCDECHHSLVLSRRYYANKDKLKRLKEKENV
jgi:hypothetical protein